MTKYTLQAELDRITKDKIAVVLYAEDDTGHRTGLMNTNKLSNYVDDDLLAEDSTDPLFVTEHEAKWLIFTVLKDWEEWQTFLEYDMEGQDIG